MMNKRTNGNHVICGEAYGMPVGLHLMADHLEEHKMLKAAWEVEQL